MNVEIGLKIEIKRRIVHHSQIDFRILGFGFESITQTPKVNLSCLSVRLVMDSRSNSSSRKKSPVNDDMRHGRCLCGQSSVEWTSWTKDNLGRRFFGCSLYKVCDCGFLFALCDVNFFLSHEFIVFSE